MKQKDVSSPAVPTQEEGKSVDLYETVKSGTDQEADDLYDLACSRLLDPSRWHELAGPLSAVFKLEKDRQQDGLKQGDFMMIDLPAPGNPTGEGHDWVKVESIQHDNEKDSERSIAVTVRASVNPHQPEQGVAHFFNEGSTSSFIIKKKANVVTASYHGRNEKPNTKEVGLTDKIRNSLVATGAMAGLSEIQWTALLKAFLKNDFPT